jgi:choline dehydrogenase-like flavoprotein
VRLERGRAVGVDYRWRGQHREAQAEREVILAGGAINSPQLLLLSGIGDADELAAHDIAPVVHLPGVGRNLQDHLEIYVQHACLQPVSLYGSERPLRKLWIGANWLFLGRGIGASNSSRRARSSARAQASSTRICSIISCRSRSITTAAIPIRATASRPMSARCARPRPAG